jgi:hypothetical protein
MSDAGALQSGQAYRERFHRTAVMQLQQRYLAIQNRLDRAYDVRLSATSRTNCRIGIAGVARELRKSTTRALHLDPPTGGPRSGRSTTKGLLIVSSPQTSVEFVVAGTTAAAPAAVAGDRGFWAFVEVIGYH